MARKRWRILALLLATLLLLSLTGEALAERQAARMYPAPGRLVDVGGFALHLNCTGQGRPVVVLEAGMGGWSNDWVRVQPALAQTTTVCSYDRAGFGWSQASPAPRTAAAWTQELHTLLQNGGVPGPYVLAGHSLGGLLVQHYAATYPQEVVGLVLVDSAHERQLRREQELTGRDPTPTNTLQYTGLIFAPTGITRLVMRNLQDTSILPETDGVKRAFKVTSGALRAEIAERKALSAVYDEVAMHPPHFGETPLVVLSRDRYSIPQERTFWLELQQDLASRSTRGRQVTVAGSGHYIHYEQPGVVIDAIRGVVDQVTKGLTGFWGTE